MANMGHEPTRWVPASNLGGHPMVPRQLLPPELRNHSTEYLGNTDVTNPPAGQNRQGALQECCPWHEDRDKCGPNHGMHQQCRTPCNEVASGRGSSTLADWIGKPHKLHIVPKTTHGLRSEHMSVGCPAVEEPVASPMTSTFRAVCRMKLLVHSPLEAKFRMLERTFLHSLQSVKPEARSFLSTGSLHNRQG